MAPSNVQFIVISGKTYDFRLRLGRAGASYSGTRRCWEIEAAATREERAAQLQLANELTEAGLKVELETRPLSGDLLLCADAAGVLRTASSIA